MRRLGVAVLLALALVAVGPRAARAANVRFATPGGSGAQPCLESAPCNSEKALTGSGANGVADGDSIVLLPGTYHPTESLIVTHSVTISGRAGSPAPLIEGAGNYGLEVQGTSFVHDLRIDQASGVTGLFMLGAGTVERVYVTSEAPGEAACAFFGAVVRDSVCEDSATGAAAIKMQSGGHSTTSATLDNVAAVGALGIKLEASFEADIALIGTNVIAAGTTRDLEATTDSSSGVGATINLSHSNFSTLAKSGAATSIVPATANGNQSAKPLFVNAATGDFREAVGSPTIAAGDLSVVLPGELDLDRSPRSAPLTCGAAPTVDIGAYQSPPAGDCGPPSSSPAPSPPSSAGPRVRVSCPKGAKPGGCKLKLQVFSAKPTKTERKGKHGPVKKPVAETALARVRLKPGRSALVTLKPKPRFAAKLDAARKLLVREVETVRGKTHTSYRLLKVVR